MPRNPLLASTIPVSGRTHIHKSQRSEPWMGRVCTNREASGKVFDESGLLQVRLTEIRVREFN